MADFLNMELEYSWEPFTFQGKHLTFHEHRRSRLSSAACSHWGPAVYKWEGLLTKGEHMGETGVLIGQCDDLRQRIKQYVSVPKSRETSIGASNFSIKAAFIFMR